MTDWLYAHGVDIVIILTLAWYGYDGWSRGFLLLCFETLGFVVALVLATLGYRPLGAFLDARFDVPPSFADAIALFTLWWGIDLLWPIPARALYARLPERWRRADVNRGFGVVPGLLNGALVLGIMLTVILAFPLPAPLKKSVTDSPLAKPLVSLSSAFDRLLKPVLGPLAESSVNLLTIHPESDETVDLHFSTRTSVVDPAAEDAMLKLVNEERAKAGLKPLVADEKLRAVARAHSRDMFERGYFAHVDPDGLNPQNRVDRAGIRYGIMGENLALAPDLQLAHDGLMQSPGHRANILQPDFRKVGIGVMDGGVYGKMFTQVFTD